MSNYFTHLECSVSSEHYSTAQILSLSKASRPLLVRYDLNGMRNEVSKQNIATSTINCFWRYMPMPQVTKPHQP